MYPTGQLHDHTLALFDAINTLDLDRLRALVADDYGIVDVDPQGQTVVIDTVAEWEEYMTQNFAAMRAASAELRTDVTDYQEQVTGEMGYVVVKFTQHVKLPGQSFAHACVATVVWRREGDRWREARWHCSRLPDAS